MEKTRILCLDDSEIALEMLEATLSEEGFEVFTTSNWPEVNSYIFREKIKVFLCDINMPGLTGVDLCKILKESVPDIKIILFSSLEKGELRKLSSSCGADGWISKKDPPELWGKKLLHCLSLQC
ncbi:MAG: response regulator [Planctomycetota bacterium]|nr:MAG: response regulator [Planctomycetota bacterium]